MIKLREHERKTLLAIESLGGKASTEQLIEATKLPDATLMRAILALQEKKLVQTSEKKQAFAKLTEEGRIYAKIGLPERRLINALKKLGEKAELEKITQKAGLEKQFIPIALGWIQRKKWAAFDSKTKTLQALEMLEEGNDEKLLKLLGEKKQAFPVDELSQELQSAVQILRGRKLLEVEEKTKRIVEITDAGWKALEQGLKAVEEITQLTPELIISGKWRKVKFQKYNIGAPVAKTWAGKKHPYLQFLDEVKQKLVTLGFKEMTGTAVETSFFNFDALYMPQDHPAREIFGIYLVKKPKYGDLNAYKKALANVKKTHEDGWKTGSCGWKYRYSLKEAKRLILRGHGTCLSARTLLSKDLKIPSRYFSIARCYRPEVLVYNSEQ